MTITSETKRYPETAFFVWIRTQESITDDESQPQILSIDKFTIGSEDEAILMPNRAKVKLRFNSTEQAKTWYNLLTAYPDRADWAAANIRHENIADGYLIRGRIDPELVTPTLLTTVIEITIVDEHINMKADIVENTPLNGNVYDLKTLIIQQLMQATLSDYPAIDFQTRVKATFAGGVESSASGFKWLHSDLLSPAHLAFVNSPIKTYADVYKAVLGTLQSVLVIDIHSNLVLFPKYYDYRAPILISQYDIVNNSISVKYVKKRTSANLQYATYVDDVPADYQSIVLGEVTVDSSKIYQLVLPFPCGAEDQWGSYDYSVFMSNNSTFVSGLVYHDSIQFAGYAGDYDTYWSGYSFKQYATWRFERLFQNVYPDVVLTVSGKRTPAAFYQLPADISDMIFRVKQAEYDFNKNQTKLTLEVALPLV